MKSARSIKVHALARHTTMDGCLIAVCGQYIMPAYEPAKNNNEITCKRCMCKLGINLTTKENDD